MRSALIAIVVWVLTAEGERLFQRGIVRGKERILHDIIQLMHSFGVDIRICQPENSDVHRGEQLLLYDSYKRPPLIG